jgi:hypothetical protein
MLGMTLESAWIATAVGLAGGVALAIALVRAVLPRIAAASPDPLLMVRLAFAGTVVAALPALVLSLVVGATLGGALGRQLSALAGLGATAVPVGQAFGTALVFAVVLLTGTASGVALGKALFYRRQRRARR